MYKFSQEAVHRLNVARQTEQIAIDLAEATRSYKALWYQREQAAMRGIAVPKPPPVLHVAILVDDVAYTVQTRVTDQVAFEMQDPPPPAIGPAVFGLLDPNNPGLYFVGSGDRMQVKTEWNTPNPELYTATGPDGRQYQKRILGFWLRYVPVP